MMHLLASVLMILCLFTPLISSSDDIEVYLGNRLTDHQTRPNVIFLLDTSGSMERTPDDVYIPPGDATESRLDIVREAAIDILNDVDGINISLMRFMQFNLSGGYVDVPMAPIEDVRSDITQALNGYLGEGTTPLTESLDEALRYLRGDEARYGFLSSPEVLDGLRYKSPLTHHCQPNYIVLFSDGSPLDDKDSNSLIEKEFEKLSLKDKNRIIKNSTIEQCNKKKYTRYFSSDRGDVFTENTITYYFDDFTRENCIQGGCYTEYRYRYYATEIIDGSCAEELALTAYVNDLSAGDEGLPGIQNVILYTVGGFTDEEAQLKLKNIAVLGAPEVAIDAPEYGQNHYAADTLDGLKLALKTVFKSILEDGVTFAAPAVSVNAFNALEHSDQLYYTVFKPSKSAHWFGNLKRYRLTSGGDIVDINDQPAIDSHSGFFSARSHSFWTLAEADGSNVRQGGAASRLLSPLDPSQQSGRMVTTYLSSSSSLSLVDSINRIHPTNVTLTNEALSLPSDYSNDDRIKLLRWASGIDANDGDGDGRSNDTRIFMEDPLHSQPVIINYEADPNDREAGRVIFVATNSGYLHAFSTHKDNPQEYFSFIPEDLLNNLDAYYSNVGRKHYGLDGALSYVHNDSNFNGQVDNIKASKNKEYVHLYMGMRRGGRNYYALDVSDVKRPRYLWKIEGGKGEFKKLGQTWSKMVPAKVYWQGKPKEVLLFGGGYDANTEDCVSVEGALKCTEGPAARQRDNMGNAIFMVSAEAQDSGTLLWSASNESADINLREMTNSIVSDVVVVDNNSDGYVDILYSADVGGRVWRFDFNRQSRDANDFALGGVIADLNGGDAQTNIRFYTTPDVAYSQYGSQSVEGQFQISLGSGYRAHPLDNRSQNRFYIINDYSVFNAPSIYPKLTERDLADAQRFDTASKAQKRAGSYYRFSDPGEKVLSNSITVADNILFTSYRPNPDEGAADSCSVDIGLTRLYQVKAIAPTVGGNPGEEDPTARDWGYTDLAQGGIPPQPVILFPPTDNDPAECPSDDQDCQYSGAPADPDEPMLGRCDELAAFTSVGTEIIATGISRCDQLYRTYWQHHK